MTLKKICSGDLTQSLKASGRGLSLGADVWFHLNSFGLGVPELRDAKLFAITSLDLIFIYIASTLVLCPLKISS